MKLLVVDDDVTFRTRLARALGARGLEVHQAGSVAEGREVARRVRPGRAVVDLRMPGESGLELVSSLVEEVEGIDVIILTGYGSIPTAVEAVRRGAHDYLTKPCDADEILAAFEREGEKATAAGAAGSGVGSVAVAEKEGDGVPSLARVEWEYIQRVLLDCGGNISEAARRLKIHRRSLQRKLLKDQPNG